MTDNRGVVYIKPGVVEVHDIADPKFEDPHGGKINHAVILKVVRPISVDRISTWFVVAPPPNRGWCWVMRSLAR